MTETSTQSAEGRSGAAAQMERDADFLAMRRRKNGIALMLTALMCLIYYGFIALMAFGQSFLATKISGSTTIGIPIGIGVILSACLLTGIYAAWANKTYDHEIARLKAKHNL